MSDEHVAKTIEMVQAQIADLERQANEKRRVVNDLCHLIGRDPIYGDCGGASSASVVIRRDEFYGRPLATVVRAILEKRQLAHLGAATVAEIYSAMVEGGFHFEAKNEANAKRGLYISLSKNTVFHRLPNGTYGLADWYPNRGNKGNGGRAASGKSGEDDKSVSEADEEQLDEAVTAELKAKPR